MNMLFDTSSKVQLSPHAHTDGNEEYLKSQIIQVRSLVDEQDTTILV